MSHFSLIFALFKLPCLVILIDKNLPKRTIFGILYELLSTGIVNVARFARTVEGLLKIGILES